MSLLRQREEATRGQEPDGAAAANGAGAMADYAVPELRMAPPWQVRHAKRLLAAGALVGTAALSFAAYYLWSLHSNPLDRVNYATKAREPLPEAPPPSLAPPAPAEPEAPAPKPEAPAPKPAAPAAKAAAPKAKPPAPPLRQSPPPVAVTHTRAPEAVAAPAPPPPAPRPAGCSEAVAALGLCGTEMTNQGR